MARISKKERDDINKTCQRVKDGKEKLISSEVVYKYIQKRLEKRKHFPYNIIYKIQDFWSFSKHWVSDKWYYIISCIFYKHNVVKIKTLSPTWSDIDVKLLHASFTLFCRCVEKENVLDSLKYNADYYLDVRDKLMSGQDIVDCYDKKDIGIVDAQYKDYYDAWDHLSKLYNWWTNNRLFKLKEIDEAWDNIDTFKSIDRELDNVDKSNLFKADNLEKDLYEEETKSLITLMRYRKYLWT